MFWWLMKYVVLGPILRLFWRPKVRGLENLPDEGAAILAPNHESFLDDFLLPLVIPKRKIRMMTKADYFDKWYSAWFFKAAGCVPVRREGGSASLAALQSAIDALRAGELVGIFPEGTRSPDGRLYRGKTGVARMALEARVPIIPVAIQGTFEAWPYHRKLPKPGRVTIVIGKPLSFERYYDRAADRFVLRSVTDEVMYEIMLLSDQEYVDEYGTKMKAHLDAARMAEGERPAGDRAAGERAVLDLTGDGQGSEPNGREPVPAPARSRSAPSEGPSPS